ncbi:MAG: AMP-binding protein [Bacillus sp. (in: Bacteria)]|nr:AMP-binding protein [Bacillus sp. (in: firmicutes)]
MTNLQVNCVILELLSVTVGSICLSRDHVASGYYQNVLESTRAVKNSWLFSGDLARFDDEGYVYIVDRKKD